MKVIDLRNGSGNGPPLYSFNLGLIDLGSLSGHNITKENNLKSKELTLPKFSM